jgi:hypothetical protein
MTQLETTVETIQAQVTSARLMFQVYQEDVEHRATRFQQVKRTSRVREELGLLTGHTASAHELLKCWPIPDTWYRNVHYLKNLENAGYAVSQYAMRLEMSQENLFPVALDDEDVFVSNYDEQIVYIESEQLPQDRTHYSSGLSQDGRLDLDCNIVEELLSSYIHGILRLYPFLDRSELQQMFRAFKRRYSINAIHLNITSPAGDSFRNVLDPSECGIECSLQHAIVLLVLALSKVCSHLNGGFRINVSRASGPKDIMDAPGIAYYTRAAAFLGAQNGGLTIAHAQAFILAALYLGHLTRVVESWTWANKACLITALPVKQ